MTVAYIFYAIYKKRAKISLFAIPVIIATAMFMYSYIYSDKVNAGATTESIVTVFGRDPMYFLLFGLNTFASDILSIEIVNEFNINIFIF